MSVTFTNELVLQLIQIYKNYELLWDTSNRDSKDRSKKNDAWEDIAKIMNMPRREVEAKIHTLRSQFSREKKKIALLKKHGRDDKYSSWFAYEPMKFLLKLDDNYDNMEMQAQQNVDDKFPEAFQSENFQIAAPVHYESTGTTTPPSSSKGHNNSRKRTMSFDEKSDGDDTMGYSFAKHFGPSKSTHDEFDIYAQYVASELRETKHMHSALVAKHLINNILFNARMGKYRRGLSTAQRSIKSEYDVNILDGTSNHDD